VAAAWAVWAASEPAPSEMTDIEGRLRAAFFFVSEHDPEKAEAGFPKKVMLKQKDKIVDVTTC
jgi:hypothetical protein